ncbi:hypothetical protein NG798_15125 [Ancylothrix sp. C2]|uniref:hypothetical protein n=1 Tax=Ancylothrix sp. D3o TaxID=2953691 RepID=UPI0021BADE0E|nr:hypothetical protein [Ancylothrix sp. D3o]MCT7951130.1 hypothetical protein [Ancylothrix sp. D3o]
MTRFIHDQFAKDYLEELLSPFGTVQAPRRVAAEVREIDVWFSPASENQASTETLGLLGRLATTPCIFEPFRNPATPQEIGDCLVKILEIRRHLWREANRNNTDIEDSNLAKLWIFSPTASESVLSGFGAIIDDNGLPGVYFMPSYFRTAIVVIHQLPRTTETLWLRILGKGTVQKKAIDELERLPANNPFRKNALTLLNRLKADLQITPNKDSEDQELVMRLSPLFDQQLEQAQQQGLQQGLQQGQRRVIESLLRSRFGELDSQLAGIIDAILALPPEESTPLLLQLSREELLARFTP